MRIGVLGTGTVGQALAGRLHELGHDVVLGTRDPEESANRRDPQPGGSAPVGVWLGRHPGIRLAAFADAAAWAEMVVNATNGRSSLAALEAAGAENLRDKVLVDVANALDFSAGMPPSLLVKDTDSLGEQIQRAFPDARVVKTLNTMTARLMVEPRQLADGAHTVFVSGDDAGAKQAVTGLLTSMGHTDVLDLGDISTARGPEQWLPLWLRLMGTLGTPEFNLRIVR